MRLGVSLDDALPAVCDLLPYARPNCGFRAALQRLEKSQALRSVAGSSNLDSCPSSVGASTAGSTA